MDQDTTTLRGLLESIATGDEAAMGRLYDLTINRCYGLALRIVRDPASAEDVSAEVYLQVWQEAKSYDSARGSPLAWLLMITRSRAIDLLRKKDRAETHPSPEILGGEFLQHDDPFVLTNAMEQNSRVREALISLADEPRQVIALAFFRGYTHDEIANHLDIPLGTVKSHIRRGQQRMRAILSIQESDGETQVLLN